MKHFRRIFSFIPMCHWDNIYYSSNFAKHYYEGLADVVDTVTPKGLSWKWCEHDTEDWAKADETIQSLCEQIKAAHREAPLDMVLSHAYTMEFGHKVDLMEYFSREMNKLGIPWVNFFCDSLHYFHKVEEIAKRTTLNWFVESESIPKYKSLNRPTLCKPYVFNMKYMPLCEPSADAWEASFVGQPTNSRTEIIGKLIKAGIEVQVAGHGWKEMGERLEDKPTSPDKTVSLIKRFAKGIFQADIVDKINRRIYWPSIKPYVQAGKLSDDDFHNWIRKTKVNIGLSDQRRPDGSNARFLKLRELEFPGFGACLLTQRHKDIEDALVGGKEILFFEKTEEARDIILDLRKTPERIQEIGKAGREAVAERHTWAPRLKQIAEALANSEK